MPTLAARGVLLAMLGRFDEAWPLAWTNAERHLELTGNHNAHASVAEIATLAGDHETAERLLADVCEELESTAQRDHLSTYAPRRGRSLCALGRYDDAEPLAQLGREIGAEDDIQTQMLWRQVQALADASRGKHAQAEPLAREAVAVAAQTDALNMQGDALCDLAEVLTAAGREGEAAAALAGALSRYERKRNLPMAHRARERLAGLQPA